MTPAKQRVVDKPQGEKVRRGSSITKGMFDNFLLAGQLHQVGAARSTILRPSRAQSSFGRRFARKDRRQMVGVNWIT